MSGGSEDDRFVRCWILRGGTSRGVFLLEEDLPPRGPERDRCILEIMGRHGAGRIDGLGGESILTSKVAIVGAASRPDADADYTFVQVGVDHDTVNDEGNCGNICAAVGPFAIERGLVVPVEGETTVRVHSVSTGSVIRCTVPVRDGRPERTGSFRIDGVPGSGARIRLDFAATAGALTGRLLPLGEPCVTIHVDGVGPIEVSVVDLANPVVFVRARDLGLAGDESPEQIERDGPLLDRAEAVRGWVAERLGLVERAEEAAWRTPYLPFLCFVAPPPDVPPAENSSLDSRGEIDIRSRMIGYRRVHRHHPGTGAVALAAASRVSGSLVRECVRPASLASERIRIGHPSGRFDLVVRGDAERGFEAITLDRTWRKILEGRVYLSG